MGTFQNIIDVAATTWARFSLLGGLYLIFVGMFIPILRKKLANPLKTVFCCILLGGCFIISAAFICFCFYDGFQSFLLVFQEILLILVIGVVLLFLGIIVLGAYWDVITGETRKEDTEMDDAGGNKTD